MKNKLRNLVGILFSTVLIYLVLFQPRISEFSRGEIDFFAMLFSDARIHLHDLVEAWRLLDVWCALAGVLLLILSIFLRTFRWRLIISQVGPVPFWTVFHATNIGSVMNNVLPLRAGELLRAMVVARRSGLHSASILTTVIVERVFDMAGLAIAFGVVLLFYPFPGWVRGAGGIVALTIVLMLIFALFLSHSTNRLRKWHASFTGGEPTLTTRLRVKFLELLDGLSVLRSSTSMFHIFWSTTLLWAMYILVMQLVMAAFRLTEGSYPLLADLHFIKAGVLTIITSLGFAIPSAPGAVGTYHAAVLLGLSWFDVPEGLAVIFAAVMHAVNYLTLSAFGVIGLWRLKLRFSDVLHSGKKIPAR